MALDSSKLLNMVFLKKEKFRPPNPFGYGNKSIGRNGMCVGLNIFFSTPNRNPMIIRKYSGVL
ncbi:hypothetical protein M8C21_021698 [Ambrosia artemisiifolia]|uniref:Uncharacterized protein n=1 Tax=Ambrosia artemisiifolia TaxID=4212 RepID=A0AAD5BRG3_AMBAR|nr:hypothetical protein M8C21_021698 [Ambrosia artemisiifolia]